MNKRLTALFIVTLFVTIAVLSVIPVNAQNGSWIKTYTITDLSSGQSKQEVDFNSLSNSTSSAVLAGEELNITITIQIPAASPGQSVTLSTPLEHSKVVTSQYWQLHGSYSGISTSNYNPNQKTVTFNLTSVGTLSISCYGVVPSTLTVTTAGPLSLDKKVDYKVVKLTDSGSNTLDSVSITISDSTIDTFDLQVANAQTTIQTMTNNGVDQSYIALYQNLVDLATYQAGQGLVVGGAAILAQIQSAPAPGSANAPAEASLFYPAVIALVVVVVLVGFMFVRARGKVSYSKLIIEDQIKDLEGLTLRAQRIDKNLTASLESVKDRLKSLVEV
jgi:hypothetical protein